MLHTANDAPREIFATTSEKCFGVRREKKTMRRAEKRGIIRLLQDGPPFAAQPNEKTGEGVRQGKRESAK